MARTNAFFMGGGKALVNAYYRSAEALGVRIRYDTPVDAIELADGRFVAARIGKRTDRGARLRAGRGRLRVEPRVAARGLGHERARRAAGRELPDPRHAASTPGVLLKRMLEAGADAIGDPTQAHMVAIDARAPLYDGGICTRIDCVSLGVVVNRDGERFYDEGEDFWPKRYAIWGRLVALQPGQIGYSIIDAKAIGRFMPPVFPGTRRDTLAELARALALAGGRLSRDPGSLQRGVSRPGTFDHTTLDDCATEGLVAAPRRTGRGRSTRRRSSATRCGPASPSLTSG